LSLSAYQLTSCGYILVLTQRFGQITLPCIVIIGSLPWPQVFN